MIKITTIKKKREGLGLSQTELARKLDVTQGAVSQWENGTSRPDIDSLLRLADVFNCTIDDLIAKEVN